MADDLRRTLEEVGVAFADAPLPREEDGMDGVPRAPAGLTVAEIEAEIVSLLTACEIQQSVLAELHLAVDRTTFGLRVARTRIEILRGERTRRLTARASS